MDGVVLCGLLGYYVPMLAAWLLCGYASYLAVYVEITLGMWLCKLLRCLCGNYSSERPSSVIRCALTEHPFVACLAAMHLESLGFTKLNVIE